jgi:uncharacterized membrane protein
MESRAKLFGHPIHQQLIVFPLGLLGMGTIFDIIDWVADEPQLARAAYYMIAAGIITGLLAAVFGLIDYLAIPSGTRAKGIATTHGVGNVIIVVLFIIAWFLRRDDPAAPSTFARILEIIGLVMALGTGWLGGELVDRLGVGVDPGANLNAPSSLSGPAPTSSDPGARRGVA